MSLSLLLVLLGSAQAGTAVWLDGTPDPALVPGSDAVSLERAVSDPSWTEADARAVAFLAEELAAVRTLADIFDGELQIMVRLQTALAEIRVLRPEDRDLVYEALIFQGYAVHRYFQDGLATDPAAEPYRAEIQGRSEVAPWVDAVALNPEATPTSAQISDPEELLAFQELRARHLLTPIATVVAEGMPSGARLVVDGRETATDRARVLPGQHRISVVMDGRVRARFTRRLAPGEQARLAVPAMVEEMTALAERLRAGGAVQDLPAGVRETLSGLDQPVQLVLSSRRAPLVFDVDGDKARLREGEAKTDAPRRFEARASLGGGWLYDGEFLLQNQDDGATETKGTVNAVTPWLGLAGEYRPLPWAAAGAGVDLGLPLGDHHDLPVGDGRMRLRAYPHLALGHPLVQATVGLLLPWHLGLGARVHVPVGDLLEVQGAYLYGLGLTLPRDVGDDFQPLPVQSAWLGVGARIGR